MLAAATVLDRRGHGVVVLASGRRAMPPSGSGSSCSATGAAASLDVRVAFEARADG